MKPRAIFTVLGCLALGGCIDPLIALGVEVGGRAIIAGVDAATSSHGDSDVAAYCWDPMKQSASTSTSPSCWSPEIKISEDEYEKFKDSGVRPASVGEPTAVSTVAGSSTTPPNWKAYCWDPVMKTAYREMSAGCYRGDEEITAAEYDQIQSNGGKRVATAGGVSTAQATSVKSDYDRIYCWDPAAEIAYSRDGSPCVGSDRKISEEQFKELHQKRIASAAAAESQNPAPIAPPATPPIVQPPNTDAPAAANANVAETPPTLQASIEAPTALSLERLSFLGTGSAFFVSRTGHLLTNEHVTRNCPIPAIATDSGIYRVSVLSSDSAIDLSLAQFPSKRTTFAAFSNQLPEAGDDTYAIGFPLYTDYWDLKVTKGIISGLSGPDGDRRLIQMSAPVQPGNSGGPLINSAGFVVGVVESKRGGLVAENVVAEGIGFAVAPVVAAAFLKANGVDPAVSQSTKKREARDIVRDARRWTVPFLCFSDKAPG
jgi:S1-C subfamily serine protease